MKRIPHYTICVRIDNKATLTKICFVHGTKAIPKNDMHRSDSNYRMLLNVGHSQISKSISNIDQSEKVKCDWKFGWVILTHAQQTPPKMTQNDREREDSEWTKRQWSVWLTVPHEYGREHPSMQSDWFFLLSVFLFDSDTIHEMRLYMVLELPTGALLFHIGNCIIWNRWNRSLHDFVAWLYFYYFSTFCRSTREALVWMRVCVVCARTLPVANGYDTLHRYQMV